MSKGLGRVSFYFMDEFRQEVIALWARGGRCLVQIAGKLDLSSSMRHPWRKRHEGRKAGSVSQRRRPRLVPYPPAEIFRLRGGILSRSHEMKRGDCFPGRKAVEARQAGKIEAPRRCCGTGRVAAVDCRGGALAFDVEDFLGARDRLTLRQFDEIVVALGRGELDFDDQQWLGVDDAVVVRKAAGHDDICFRVAAIAGCGSAGGAIAMITPSIRW